jgi:hypothetical protein
MLTINEYFDSAVKSIGFENAEGKVTSGVMDAGEYEFGTSQKELMKVISGELVVKLPGSEEWQSFPAGSAFNVDANQSFQVKVAQPTAYLCYYS